MTPTASIEVDGRGRALITVVPAGYRPEQPHALVIAFHGRTNSNAEARAYYDLERAAGAPTIFAYPAGRRARDRTYSWSDPGDPAASLPDLALFDALLARLSSLYCIDRSRIFAAGHSLGAWFANSLGCARGDVLRAIGTIAGGISPTDCRGDVAAMLFHNPNDRQVGYRDGLAARDRLRAANGLGLAAQAISASGFACQRHGAADAADPVLWCPYTGNRTRTGRYYPHHWPEGAGRAIMGFFGSLPGGRRRPTAEPGARSDQPGPAGWPPTRRMTSHPPDGRPPAG